MLTNEEYRQQMLAILNNLTSSMDRMERDVMSLKKGEARQSQLLISLMTTIIILVFVAFGVRIVQVSPYLMAAWEFIGRIKVVLPNGKRFSLFKTNDGQVFNV